MEFDTYSKKLIKLADAYSAGELSPDEFHSALADLRDRKLEGRRTPESLYKKYQN